MPTFDTTGRLFTGIACNRDVFRKLLPDDRWLVYCAGWVNPGDANAATISIQYEKDDQSLVQLGSGSYSGSGWVKFSLGPFDVFETALVPGGETIPVIRLKAVKAAGVDGEIQSATLWLRFLPRIF